MNCKNNNLIKNTFLILLSLILFSSCEEKKKEETAKIINDKATKGTKVVVKPKGRLAKKVL